MKAAKALVGIDGHTFRNQFVGRVSNIGIDYLTGEYAMHDVGVVKITKRKTALIANMDDLIWRWRREMNAGPEKGH